MTEKELLVALLIHPAGFHCGLFGVLELRSVGGLFADEEGFIVGFEVDGMMQEEPFDAVEPAVDRFLALRQEHKLGLDFEATTIDKLLALSRKPAHP